MIVFFAFFLIFSKILEGIHKNTHFLTKTKSAYLTDLIFGILELTNKAICVSLYSMHLICSSWVMNVRTKKYK
jgi:hypothetical protein